jgi:predicted acetyltransferase
MTNISIEKARNDQMPIVLNMASLYRYDLSEFTHWSIEEDGMHYCYGLEMYWGEGNFPYIIYVDNELAGFALISSSQSDNRTVYEMGEFFVLRKFRKLGVAKYVVLKLLDLYKGDWEVAQLASNQPAISFWHKLLTLHTQGKFELSNVIDEDVGVMCVMKFKNEG